MSTEIILAVDDPHLLVADLRDAADEFEHRFVAPESAARLGLIADQIEAQTRPPKPPEVYEHLPIQQRGKTVEAVCGKAWIPNPAVTVVGKCPECLKVAESGWVA